MKGLAIQYSDQELEFIKANCVLGRKELREAFVAAFDRQDIKVDDIKSLCTRKGWKTGRDGCFPKGNVPANLGKKMPFNANSAATQFHKGRLPHNTKYLGHERISKDGYVEISIAETDPHTGFERRYVLKHRHEWEMANGKIPKGMALKCLDGNPLNTAPKNWELVPRALLPILNGGRFKTHMSYDEAPAELKPSLMAVAKLKHKVRDRSKSRKGVQAFPMPVSHRRAV